MDTLLQYKEELSSMKIHLFLDLWRIGIHSQERSRVETWETFSANLKSEINTPNWFYTGEWSSSILNARLMMLCSPLNDQHFSFIHVIESPKYACGHAHENNKHFLLDCPLYRETIFDHLEAIGFRASIINIFYGNVQYSIETNYDTLSIIQK